MTPEDGCLPKKLFERWSVVHLRFELAKKKARSAITAIRLAIVSPK
jgi:hypothetical protein